MAGVKGMHQRASRSAAYAEAVRARIRAGGIAKRLEGHVLGKVEMTSTQVQAALGLLKKVVPDQQQTEISGPGGGDIPVSLAVSFLDATASESPEQA
jgi:hypothetical protein